MRLFASSQKVDEGGVTTARLIALILAGMILGYFSQANWAHENHEVLPWWRALLGMVILGAAYPPLVWAWTRLSAWLLNLEWARAFGQAVTLCAGIALVFFYPSETLDSNGILAACVIFTFLAALLPMALTRELSPAFLLCLGLLALLCVELHDQTTRYYDAVNIWRGLKGDAQALFRYRVLVHYLSGWIASALQCDAGHIAILIRTFATFAIFIISIKVCRLWFKSSIALAAPFLHMVMLPFSYLFLYVTDEVEVLGAWCLLWATARQRHGWALLVMLFFTLNRELLIFLGPWFFVYTALTNGWSWKSPAWRYSALMVIGVLALHFALVLLLGFSYHDNAAHYRFINAQFISAWLDYLSPGRLWNIEALAMAEPLKYAGGVWLAAMVFYRKLPRIIALGIWICLPLFWILQGMHGGFLECRELYPLLPFMVCAVLCFADQSAGLPGPGGREDGQAATG